MYQYEVNIFWSSPDQCYVASVPELPGCMADGVTAKDAIDNTEQMIHEWIAMAQQLGREVPEPKGERIVHICKEEPPTFFK